MSDDARKLLLKKLRDLVRRATDDRTPENERTATAMILAKRLKDEGVLEELLKGPEEKKPAEVVEEKLTQMGVPGHVECILCDYLAYAAHLGIEQVLVIAARTLGQGTLLWSFPMCSKHRGMVANIAQSAGGRRDPEPRKPGRLSGKSPGDLLRESWQLDKEEDDG